MTTLAEFMIIAGADNRLPMLEKSLYDSWKSRMEHYMKNRENGRMILNSVQNGPLIWPTVTDEDGTTRTKKYEEFLLLKRFKLITITKLPISFFKVFHLMSRLLSIIIKLQKRFGTEFAQLINNMNVINMSMRPVQVNTKFLNSLPPEWSKFVTDVKLARDLHTTNYDQLYSYLEQHERHANETRLMRERYQDPLAFVANYHQSPLVVPVFNQGDDLISCLNKAMAFLTALASSRFPSTNNQLRTSSNLRNQATIQDGRVTVQQVQGKQGQSYAGTSYKGNATSYGGNNTGGQARVVKCYNCQAEGHMARQCTQPKRTRNAAWFKEKAMLAEAQEAGQILDEEQLAFLADPGIPDGQTAQTTIPNTATS
ncbi:uncharacterized mitochondrial protein-like protein [Tanacetum coccineum]|uniref:Uncharacterized mitochondrial protein-like protein n=1 Tax=Tanacetum coccineum TaxID=301880 RepID=A0ABQ4Y0X0_9ASTR